MKAPTEIYNIPRPSFLWLLAAVVGVILPHVLRLPFWLTAICALCVGLRVLIYQGRLSFPGKRIKVALVLLMLILVGAQFGSQLYSTDATVALLLTGIALKLLEMQHKRDVLLVIYLCYFTIIAEFIYTQTIPITLYMLMVVLLTTTALLSLNHQPLNHQSLNESSADLPHWRSLRQSSIILLQSVPLMLVLFVIAPRLAPLWSVQVPSAENRTGLSDSMAPGDIGQLTRSAALAFRVQFSGSAPAYNQLYWRALTLDEFDGREWRRGFSPAAQMLGPQTASQQAWFAGIDYLGEPVTYNVILEPTNRNWIYTLQMPRIVDARLRMHTDYQVSSVRRITQRFSYDAVSYVDYRVPESSIRAERRRTISLPEDSNRRAHSFAQQLRQQHGSD
ncbi:MAG TPA: DUF3488 domain-containing protein, partial [Pseudomonadaceae bacterium]|nr:DUF3488 domain-containing protein [Pseudomonadaceae bacterium]